MPTTVVLRDVLKPSSGKIFVNFDGGTQLEFGSIEECREWALEPDEDVDLAQRMCLAYAYKRSDDLSNINSVKDKNFEVDFSAGSVIRVR